MKIQGTSSSGKGGINELAVNNEGEAEVFAISEQEIEHVSEANGLSFNWSSGTVDVASAGTVLLVKNTSATQNLHIENITIENGSVASEYTIHLPTTNVTVAGVTVTGTGLNTSKPEVAVASAASNESGNSQGTIIRTKYLAVDRNLEIKFPGLILGTNKSVAIDVVENTSESACSIEGFYKDA